MVAGTVAHPIGEGETCFAVMRQKELLIKITIKIKFLIQIHLKERLYL